jgi:hypothetical protein
MDDTAGIFEDSGNPIRKIVETAKSIVQALIDRSSPPLIFPEVFSTALIELASQQVTLLANSRQQLVQINRL